MNGTIQKIQRYIERTNVKPGVQNKYQMVLSEIIALKEQADESIIDTICLAFDYGRAKGYRAAKAEKEARA